jgi:enoyl-CoA hydratase/carnithine racemase
VGSIKNTGREVVLYEVRDRVATLTLNRPDRLNAWTPDMEARYFDLLDVADNDPEVRAIVVTGSGRGFCAGMDAAVLSERAQSEAPRRPRARPLSHPLSVRKLLIAAINGGCAGIGLLQALLCDVRFAASEARISTAFTRRGLPPEFGSAWLLSRIIGGGRSADLMLSGRTIDGVEAHRVGLVSDVAPAEKLLELVYAYASDVATNCSPRAIAYGKAQMAADWSRTFAESEQFSELIYSRDEHREDFGEGVRSFVERRSPEFAPVPAP